MSTPSNISPEARERIEKLLVLAQQGVGGEKTSAEKILNRTLAKLGITLEQLERPTQPEWRRFSYNTPVEKQLLFHIAYKIYGKSELKYRTVRGKKQIALLYDPVQFAEAELLYSIHRKALAKDIDTFVIAYFYKNKLLAPMVRTSDEETKLSSEELEKFVGMISLVTTPQIQQQLTTT